MRTLTYRDLIDQSVSGLVTDCHHLWLADARRCHDNAARR
jgi:hypothetical protein